MILPVSRRSFLVLSISAYTAAPGKQTSLKVGCQANAWALQPGDFEQLIRTIQTMKDLGYAGFECNIRFISGQFGRATEARKRIEATGMKFIGAHMSMQQAREQFSGLSGRVAQLGAEFIVMSGAGLSPTGTFSADALKAKAGELETLAKTCRQNGISLAYHNHTAEFSNGNAEIDALADHTDPLLVHFLIDAGHGYQSGGDPAAFLLRNSQRIVGCHLKTFRERTHQVALGQGDFGFETLAAAIEKTDWTGWLIDEEGGGPAGGNQSAVGPDREYIKKVFGV